MTNHTPARHRAFGAQPGTSDEHEAEQLEPITFDVGDEKGIRCVDRIDGFQLLVFTGVMGPGNSGSARAKAMTEFIERAVAPEEFPRFLAACAKTGLEIEDIGAICGWLADEYSERPTVPAQPSSAGRQSGGSPFEASSSSAASTGAPSTDPTSLPL